MRKALVAVLWIALAPVVPAGINKLIQQEYKARYENQTVFLAVPVNGSRQRLTLRDGSYRLEPETEPLRFKVGEQVRVLELSFHNDEIRFKLGSVDAARQGELAFRFAAELDDGFAQRKDFDAALKQVFAEGHNYSDIERSKRDFIRRQLDTVVGDFMASTSANREFVLDALADALPAYKQAVDENRVLKERNQDVAAKLSTEQSKSKQLESKVVEQTSEINRLKSSNQSFKTDLEALSTSSSGASRELQQLKQQSTEMGATIKRLQRGLNVELDASKPLSKQFEDLMVAALKTKGDRDSLDARVKASEGELGKTREDLQAQIKANTDLKKENTQLQDNLKLLSSGRDQLGQRYLALQKQKNQLESFVRAVEKLKSVVVRESEEEGRVHRTVELRLAERVVGTLEVDYPPRVRPGEKAAVRARFTAESIDYVKLADDEKKLLASLGEKLTLRQELTDVPPALTVTPPADPVKSVAERSTEEWTWQLESSRVGSVDFQLLTSFVNQNKDAIPLVHNPVRIESLNLAKQIAGYVQPVPLGLGILFGLILFAAVRAIRR